MGKSYQQPSLESVTVLSFRDGDNEFARTYPGLLNFQEGDIIDLIGYSKKMPVRTGNYVLRRKNIHNQMALALDDQSRPDTLYRYFECERLP